MLEMSAEEWRGAARFCRYSADVQAELAEANPRGDRWARADAMEKVWNARADYCERRAMEEKAMSSLEQSDAEAAAVAKSPTTRVSLEDINNAVVGEYTLNAYNAVVTSGAPAHESLKVLTICVLVCKNGFTVIGKSAPADPVNFDAAFGAKLAREDAIRQLWPLLGFSLRDRLAAA